MFQFCLDDWIDTEEGKYKIFDLNYHGICSKEIGCTWEESKRVCEKEGGHLVKITSKNQNDQITTLLAPFLGARRNFWTGLSDIETEGNFKWVSDNSPKAYHNFNSGKIAFDKM